MRVPDYIQAVSRGFLDTFSLDGETECFGYFLCRIGDERYAAVNNADGRRIREDFRSERTARLWLRGHLVLNIDNELCDGLTGVKIPDAAERVGAELERERK